MIPLYLFLSVYGSLTVRAICVYVHSRGAQGCLLVYDVASRDSFEHVQRWYDRARQLGGEDLVTVLVGNKIDLPEHDRQVLSCMGAYTISSFAHTRCSSQVSTQEGALLAQSLGDIPFLETSALSGE